LSRNLFGSVYEGAGIAVLAVSDAAIGKVACSIVDQLASGTGDCFMALRDDTV
jgi:hypothetical protein